MEHGKGALGEGRTATRGRYHEIEINFTGAPHVGDKRHGHTTDQAEKSLKLVKLCSQ